MIDINKPRLTKKYGSGFGLVKVKDDEQEVESPYPNTLKAILECFERLGELENAIESGELIARDSAEIAGWKVDDLIKAAETLVKTHGSVECEPVVHARWLPADPDSDVYFYCTKCKHDINPPLDSGDCDVNLNYCPNCGAKMDLEEEK